MNFKSGMNYEEFINTAEKEHRGFIDELHEQGILDKSDINLNKIKNINYNVDIAVFTETRCKDSATTMPFLMKLSELNKNIRITFFRKEGNEELLKDLTGEIRVPSILILNDDGKVERKYIEFAYDVKEILENSPIEKTQDIIDEMRIGKYNSEIQKDLIKLISGDEYKYISFERKDK